MSVMVPMIGMKPMSHQNPLLPESRSRRTARLTVPMATST